MQSSSGVHIAVATAKVSSWMGLMQTNAGVQMGTDTIAIAATQCEQAFITNCKLGGMAWIDLKAEGVS